MCRPRRSGLELQLRLSTDALKEAVVLISIYRDSFLPGSAGQFSKSTECGRRVADNLNCSSSPDRLGRHIHNKFRLDSSDLKKRSDMINGYNVWNSDRHSRKRRKVFP